MIEFLQQLFRRKTEAERKRDEYYKLYTKLENILEEYDKKVEEFTSAYNSYRNSGPYLSPSKIPSNDFVEKRKQLNERLDAQFENEQGKRSDLVNAVKIAYGRYEYYQSLAIREAENYEREKNK